MTRTDLIDALAAKFRMLDVKDVDISIKAIIEAMAGALAAGGRIEIRDFGSFDLKQKNPRIGRNPKTGERIQVPAKVVPRFKPGKELRERVDTIHGLHAGPAVVQH